MAAPQSSSRSSPPRPSRRPRSLAIGYLSPNLAISPHLHEAFRQGLRDLGYVEGRDLVIEYRNAEGKVERLPALAAELVALKVDVIVTEGGNTRVPLVTKQATRSLPIVFASAADAVGSGLVTSLARPGGNVTGLSGLSTELVGKRLELLTQVVTEKEMLTGAEVAARGLGCGFNSLRREVPPISTGPSPT